MKFNCWQHAINSQNGTNQKGGHSLLWNGSRFTLNRKMAMSTGSTAKDLPSNNHNSWGPVTATNGHNHPMNLTEESSRSATWLDGHFAPRTWNYHQHEGPTTNNHLVGWHNHLKSAVRKAHPNLYEFVEIVQREQAATKVTIQQLEGGGRLRA